VLLNEGDGIKAVFALGEEIDFRESLEKEGEFFAGGLFVVDDNGVDGHLERQLEYSAGRKEVASPGEASGDPRSAIPKRSGTVGMAITNMT